MIRLVNTDSLARHFAMKCEAEDADAAVSFHDSTWWFLKFFDFSTSEVQTDILHSNTWSNWQKQFLHHLVGILG